MTRPQLPAVPDHLRRPLTLTGCVLALCVCSWGAGRESMRQDGLALAALQSGYVGLAPTADHSGAWAAGADPTPEAGRPPASPEPLAPSPHRCQDVPPAVMPNAVRAWCAEIDAAADRWSMDPRALAVLVAIESAGNSQAVSPAGATGLAQLMPGTAEMMATETGLPCGSRATGVNTDPAVNLACGGRYYAGALRAAASIWHAGDEAQHVGAAGIGYHDGHGVIPAVVRHWQAGGRACDAPVSPKGRDWCQRMVDAWQLMAASPVSPDALEMGIAWRPRP